MSELTIKDKLYKIFDSYYEEFESTGVLDDDTAVRSIMQLIDSAITEARLDAANVDSITCSACDCVNEYCSLCGARLELKNNTTKQEDTV